MRVKPLNSLIKGKLFSSQFYQLEAIRQAWVKAVGHTLAQRSYPVFLKEKKLKVVVENSAWITQLNFLKKEIIHQLNTRLNDSVVDKIEFTIEQGTKPVIVEEEEEKIAFSIDSVVLSPEEIMQIKDSVKTIDDEGLRVKFYQVLLNNFKRTKKLQESGLKQCLACGRYTLTLRDICEQCEGEEEQQRRQWIFYAIKENPTISFEGLKEKIATIRLNEYQQCRDRLLDEWMRQIESEYAVSSDQFYDRAIRYYQLLFRTDNSVFIAEKIRYLIIELEEKKSKTHGGRKRGRIFSK